VRQDISPEEAASILRENKDFRILRRLVLKPKTNEGLNAETLIGIILDVETTGLDSDLDEVIELAMLKFNFDREGRMGTILETFRAFNQPEKPIPLSITEITGITDEMVAGKKITEHEIQSFVSDAVLIIAHNAAFDRPFCEKLSSNFSEYAWSCSATEIPWKDEGIVGSRLEYIAQSFNFFYDAHRAEDDCKAVAQILSLTLPKSKQLAMGALLKNARRTETRIFATGAPYELRLLLKRRGYRWNGGLNQFPRAWWRDVAPSDVDEEISFLKSLGQPTTPETFPMNARNRFRSMLS
jgi:DNA polymerase-3 subunit epsilon